MTTRGPAARLRASLVRALAGLRRCLHLPDVPRADLEALLASAAGMSELETLASGAGLPGVASALAALAMGLVGGGSVHLETAPASGARLLRPDG